jgi:hypothetical protein
MWLSKNYELWGGTCSGKPSSGGGRSQFHINGARKVFILRVVTRNMRLLQLGLLLLLQLLLLKQLVLLLLLLQKQEPVLVFLLPPEQLIMRLGCIRLVLLHT